MSIGARVAPPRGGGLCPHAAANKDIKRPLNQGALVASRTYIFERPKTAEEHAAIIRQKEYATRSGDDKRGKGSRREPR